MKLSSAQKSILAQLGSATERREIKAKRIVRTSTMRTEMHAGIAQAVVTATWSDGTLTTEALANLRYTSGQCIKI